MELLDSVNFEVYISGAWVSLDTDRCLSPAPTWNMGIMGNGPTDRTGDPEYLTFCLNNSEGNSAGLKGYYSPGHANCRSGWNTGLNVRMYFVFEGVPFYKWYGKIMSNGITVAPGIYGKRNVQVRCHGFMAQAADHPFDLPDLALNVTADAALTLLLTNMPIQPLATSFEVGISTFPTAFDTVRRNTTAIGEIQKLAISELCYIYTKGDLTGGQTLVCENRDTRTSAATLSVPVSEDNSTFVQNEDGDQVINEDGDYAINDETESLDFSGAGLLGKMSIAYGENVTNLVKARTYPRKVDAAATTVLFKTQERIELAAGETKTGIRGTYRDPAAGADYVSGRDMVVDVARAQANTDYWMDSVENSDAKDLTASLTVTATYGTEAVDYTIQNTGGTLGYVYLQARGKGIYIYDVVERISEDATSQATHGVIPLTIEMKYQNDPALGENYADYVLLREKDPQTTVEAFGMFANRSSSALLGFLYAEPGSRAPFQEDQTAVNGDYFIMGYSASLVDGKYIFWSPVLKSAGFEQGWILETSALEVDTILGTTPFG